MQFLAHRDQLDSLLDELQKVKSGIDRADWLTQSACGQ
jgi:hypothetical protein